MTNRQPGDALRDYIADARGTLGLTPPTFDKWIASEDAATSLEALESLEGLARTMRARSIESFTDPMFGVGYGTAVEVILAEVEGAIHDHQQALAAIREAKGT